MADDLWPPEPEQTPPPRKADQPSKQDPQSNGDEPQPLPWEDRDGLGRMDAFFETVRLLLLEPRRAWARARSTEGYWGPLSFAIMATCGAAAIGLMWAALLSRPDMGELPYEFRHWLDGLGLSPLLMRLLVGLMAAPFVMVAVALVTPVALFLVSCLVHLCLSMVGALEHSLRGFEGTMRAVCYSQVTQIIGLVPVLGALAGTVWELVLAAMGLKKLHHTSTGKAVAGVLLPVLLSCCIMLTLALLLGLGIGSLCSFG